MKFNFFKKKDKVVGDAPLTERELIINSIGKDKLEKVCEHMLISMDDMSLYLLNLLKDNTGFLDYASNNYLFGDLTAKINNGPIKLIDINFDNFELLKYPIFDLIEQEKIRLLVKNFAFKDRSYFCVNTNEIRTYIEPNKYTEKKISSYFNDVDIIIKKKIMPVSSNFYYSYDDITILFVKDSCKYDMYDGYYIDEKVSFDNDTIFIMSYDKFLTLSDEEVKVLNGYNLVIGDDYSKLADLYNSDLMNDIYITDEDLDYNKIMVNHLLFCVNNASLNEDRKKYYSYYISESYVNNEWYYIYDYANEFAREVGVDNIKMLTEKFNGIPDLDKMSSITSAEYTIDVFLANGYDIDNMSAFSLLYEIGKLNSKKRSIVLEDSVIRKKLREGLLEESKCDQYHYYDKILNILSVKEFISLYDKKYLDSFFGGDYRNGDKYKFFASLCQKNFNETIRYLLNDDNLFDEFFSLNDSFCSLFDNLDYELLLKCILKIEKSNREYKNDFVISISTEKQRKLLKEDILDTTIVWLLPRFKPEVISDFFQNDPRALYLFEKFDITSLIKTDKPIIFNSNILKKDDFFELLKSYSFIEFRENINYIEKYNDPSITEGKRKKYVNELICEYQMEAGMFKEYAEYLNTPDSIYSGKVKFSYIFNRDVYFMLRRNLRQDENGNYYFEDKNKIISMLKRETSLKLSEVIVDDLFEDNIYNVWINIKEMIRYNDTLDNDKKVLDDDKLKFYNFILNIDNEENNEKIKLYYYLKDKNYSSVFYDDLRKLKDTAYDNIKRSMFDYRKQENCISKESSEEYKCPVYDLRDKKFTMLVRRMPTFCEKSECMRNCYSIISDENTDVFANYNGNLFTYGYNSFENDMVLHMFEGDSFSADVKEESSRYVNRIMGDKEIANSNRWYSEVQILNEKSDNKIASYTAKRPDFIVAFDEISDMEVNESKRLNVPIVIVRSQKLKDEDIINITFNKDFDVYMSGRAGEEKRRASRL